MSEQAVIVRFRYEAPYLSDLHALEDQITSARVEAGEGEVDGHDITPDLRQATIYFYAPDAEFAFVVVQQLPNSVQT